jgi:hypothetical protein
MDSISLLVLDRSTCNGLDPLVQLQTPPTKEWLGHPPR